MSSSSERMTRGRVLHGPTVNVVPADLNAVSARPARSLVVSNELVESARREGYEAGYAAAWDQGYTDGIAQAQHHVELLAGLVRRLGEAAESLMARETTARHQLEDEVVETAFTIAETIVGHEIEQPDRRGREAIARALDLAPEQGLVVARVSPDDLALIGDTSALFAGRALELIADPSVAPGDCVVEVGACRVDARIEPALQRIRDVLQGGTS